MTLELRIRSVNVGRARVIGAQHGKPVVSAFVKFPVRAETIRVGEMALDGDECADKIDHGGPHCAIYAYPAEHWNWWETEHRLACAPSTFGENLTLNGADETRIAIGDRFAWGKAVLEVSQPRRPCYKFQIASARDDVSALMTLSARCGWYFRVIEPGEAPAANGRLVRVRDSHGPSVREIFVARADPKTDEATKLRLSATPALSPDWRRKFAGEKS